MKQCEEYELAVSCYVDGELGPGERSVLFAHLSTCERCAEFLGRTVQIRVDAARQTPAAIHGPSPLQRSAIPQFSRRTEVGSRATTIALVLFSLFLFGVILSTRIEVQLPMQNRTVTTMTP